MQITAFKAILARRINIQGCEDYENTLIVIGKPFKELPEPGIDHSVVLIKASGSTIFPCRIDPLLTDIPSGHQ